MNTAVPDYGFLVLKVHMYTLNIGMTVPNQSKTETQSFLTEQTFTGSTKDSS